jgi:hypothetical protein
MKSLTLAVVATLVSLALANGASAGILPDGNGGANCKNTTTHPGSCTLLEATCAGKYTDATDPNGTVYGKCSKVSKAALGLKAKTPNAKPRKAN